MLRVSNLSKFYEIKKHRYLKSKKYFIFENINFSLKQNENLMIEGKSGAGKSTLARILCFLENPSGGEVWYKGDNLHQLDKKRQRLLRKEIQYCFQDQKMALNPYKKIKNLIQDGLENFNFKKNGDLIDEFFDFFNLKKQILEQKPYELSGGEATRVGLIRSLILNPSLLILDEIVSTLDIKNSKEILNFLYHYQQKNFISYIFITHQSELFYNFKYEKIKL
ncbi:ATP-binding cassette domain-containing protein [Campylobacter hepaticus]|uniref:ATP-binding cassette domain-containing protein n=1 Tax=Campylobacter hepaticus TaxID=1813019 RepID=A0A6A7JS40_9BACT|nr:ATP-binding cassette domain-containing protein [Campylobacter hepaticus]AXP09362.1 ATP-binding cassette domain-containing protein [Campylobacter hepaticus]MPV54269.1 ATP-binding cassette domain-containing protein [Campylobacter hepaticus]MPV61612.1 ATP-binding cassette domain-containing protein [Campylobacter hepaticus]MPV77096.1 ATP-binding cassette domain-containing protein [Campylobacter hepaticus]MPV78547.1 ATP-binding cassette domain-containing protein [Campylobacter hepaticus]